MPPYEDGWTSVSVGSNQICGIRSGSMYCWGNIGNTTPPDIGTSWGFTGQELTDSGNFPMSVNTTSDSTNSSSNDSVALGVGLGVGIPGAMTFTYHDTRHLQKSRDLLVQPMCPVCVRCSGYCLDHRRCYLHQAQKISSDTQNKAPSNEIHHKAVKIYRWRPVENFPW